MPRPSDDALIGEVMAAWGETGYALARLTMAVVNTSDERLISLMHDYLHAFQHSHRMESEARQALV